MTAPPGQAAGLSAAEAARRLARHGPNTLRDQPPPSAARLLLRQLEGPMLWLLLGACVVAAALGETADAIAIAAIVTLNALVGFAQELRSERALAALRAMTAPRARVRRDGRAAVIPAAEVVPGDLLLLEGGDLVAADARLTLAHALTVSEATLTGESVPVDKACGDEPADAPLAERRGSVFMGTAVAAGTGEAEVVATGMGTELGKIARLLDTVEREETPLQQRLAQVGRALVIMCLVVVAVVAALGALRGQPALDVLLSSVSLAVAAVPEGLAAIVTIALAVGVQRMASRHVLIRRLASVETLGCATVICTDKTGTLTAGVMALRETWGPDHRRVVATAAACCDAELGDGDGTGDDGGAGGVGDPTELAILAAARERGIERAAIEAATPRREVFPFDADRKRMAILRDDGVLYVKGAFEELAPRCDRAPPGA
ncbi:MAG: HAD-IC family P-type ATPase, partial [Myxococcales bacterium]|nr:HAD-IC family P-type ATPase [Myxococcales bacterium]